MTQAIPPDSPFHPDNDAGFAAWRETKFAQYPRQLDDLLVELADMAHPTAAEIAAIRERCRKSNMAAYQDGTGQDFSDKERLRQFAACFGLRRLDHNAGADEDAVTALQVQDDDRHRGYIPYTNKPIAWHTDGYYNTSELQIQGMVLHCVRPAQSGGDNDLLDHEILYAELRQQSVEHIRALLHPQAMGIPVNEAAEGEPRPERWGPVFALRDDGGLHMRYTRRKRNIRWRDDAATREAVTALETLLDRNDPWHFRILLAPGQGLICNNVLHTRSGFTDEGSGRLLYRARYYEPLTF